MTIPEPFLPPPSQPWGRWVSSRIRGLITSTSRFEREARNNLRQLNIAQRQPMRALLTRQSGATVSIATAGVYVPMNIAGTIDTDVTFNMTASGAPNVTGVKNVTDQTRTMVFIATYDGKCGNNNAMGLKLALNGVPIAASECRSFGGSTGQVGKTLTQFMLKMEPNDEVTMWAANIDSTDDLIVDRFKLLAHAVQ